MRGRPPQVLDVEMSVRMVPLEDEYAVDEWCAALDWLDAQVRILDGETALPAKVVARDYRGTLIHATEDGATIFREDNPIHFLTVSEAEAFVDASLLVSQVMSSQIQHSTDPLIVRSFPVKKQTVAKPHPPKPSPPAQLYLYLFAIIFGTAILVAICLQLFF